MPVIAIIGIIFVALFFLMAIVVYYLVNLRNQFRQRFSELYPNAIFIMEVQSFGQQSLGMAQVRGNGTLALTSDTLHFQLWRPNRALAIPLNSITKLDVIRSFLGKTTFSNLLKIEFSNQDGQADAIALRLNNLDDIKQQIEQAVQSTQ